MHDLSRVKLNTVLEIDLKFINDQGVFGVNSVSFKASVRVGERQNSKEFSKQRAPTHLYYTSTLTSGIWIRF